MTIPIGIAFPREVKNWFGLAAVDPVTEQPFPVAIDPSTGALIVSFAAGGTTDTLLTEIKDAIIAQGTVTLSTEGTQLTINANIDELEDLDKAIKNFLGQSIDEFGFGTPVTPTVTSFFEGVGAAPDTIVSSGSPLIDLRPFFFPGQSLRVTGSTSNNGSYTILSVTETTIGVGNGLLTSEAGSGTEILTPKGALDPLSISGRLESILTTLNSFISPAKVNGVHSFAAATLEALGGSTPTKNGIVIVQAILDNPNPVYIGYAGVTVTNGIELNPGQSIDMPADDLDEVFGIDGVGGNVNEVRFIVK